MTSVSKNINIDKLDDIVNKYNNTYNKIKKKKKKNQYSYFPSFFQQSTVLQSHLLKSFGSQLMNTTSPDIRFSMADYRVSNARACRYAGSYSQVTKLTRVTEKCHTDATKNLLLSKFKTHYLETQNALVASLFVLNK